jgi:hypothetical protein
MSESVYYRVYDQLVSAGVDEWDNPLGPARVEVYVMEIPVISRTPKGVWLDYCGKRFVLDSSRKRFACPTVEEAEESFIARKTRQLSILNKQAANVRRAMEATADAVQRFKKRSISL